MSKVQFAALAALASKQHGLMTHAQATSVGLNRMAISRLVRAGAWQLVRPRVFRRTAASQTEEQGLLAVCLWLGDGAVVSHRSAARLLGLEIPRAGYEVTTPPRLGGASSGLTVHRSKTLQAADLRTIRGIPTTSGARTLIDLASCLDEEQLAIAVEEAWRKKIAAPDWIARRLRSWRGRGARTLTEVLADCLGRKAPLASAFEVRVWRLLRRHDLPRPIPSFEFRDDFGQPGHVDFAFPDHHLAIECDSWEFHGTREAFENDRLRAARLAAIGWRVMPLTWRQVTEEPGKVVELVRGALGFRGQAVSSPR